MFFNLLLPPIIFAAGYNLKKKYFFENFGHISFFGIIGTLLQFLIISVIGFILNEALFDIEKKLDTIEILLLGSSIQLKFKFQYALFIFIL